MTLCNRGKSNAGLFADLRWIAADRDLGTLDGLRDQRFDAVVDTSGYAPLHMQQIAQALGDRVGHYVFVSTVSVYPDQSAAVIGEDTRTSTVTPAAVAAATTIALASRDYGPMS